MKNKSKKQQNTFHNRKRSLHVPYNTISTQTVAKNTPRLPMSCDLSLGGTKHTNVIKRSTAKINPDKLPSLTVRLSDLGANDEIRRQQLREKSVDRNCHNNNCHDRHNNNNLPPFWKSYCDEKSNNTYYYNEKTEVSSWTMPTLDSMKHLTCILKAGVACRATRSMKDRCGNGIFIKHNETVTGMLSQDGEWLCIVSEFIYNGTRHNCGVSFKHGSFVPLRKRLSSRVNEFFKEIPHTTSTRLVDLVDPSAALKTTPTNLLKHLTCIVKVGVACRTTRSMKDRCGKGISIKHNETVTGTLHVTSEGEWLCIVSENSTKHGKFVPLRGHENAATSDTEEYFKELPQITTLLVGATVQFTPKTVVQKVYCSNKHLMKHDPKVSHFCDTCRANGVRTYNTTHRCSSYCDYDMCHNCYTQEVHKQMLLLPSTRDVGEVKEYVQDGEFAGCHKVVHADGKGIFYYTINDEFANDLVFSCSLELYSKGMKVRCRWKSMKGKYYNCTIKNKNKDNTYSIDYEDGDTDASVDIDRLTNMSWGTDPGKWKENKSTMTKTSSFKVLNWQNYDVERAAMAIKTKNQVFDVLKNLKQNNKIQAEQVLKRLFKVLRGCLQYRKRRAVYILNKFSRHVILQTKPKRIKSAMILQRFLHPLLRKRRIRKLKHLILIEKRNHIMKCLVPPATQPRSCRTGLHVIVRNPEQQQGIVVKYDGGASAKVQMLLGEGTKNINVSDLIMLPAGISDISAVLSVNFDDLINNQTVVLERCETSLKSSTKILKRRAKLLHVMMNELVDIWKNKIPASCFKTVFEEQAKLLATTSITNIALFNESALLAINQEGGGFSIPSFERSIAFWEEEWRIPPNEPCSICFNYQKHADYISSSTLTKINEISKDWIGSTVSVAWFNKKKYVGKVDRIDQNGKYVVIYEDGEEKSYNIMTSKTGKITAYNKDNMDDIHTFTVTNKPGWIEKVSSTQKKTYYYHSATGESVWELPSNVEPETKNANHETNECTSGSLACQGCLRDYCRIAMTQGTPIWSGIPCFCGCSAVIPDHKTKSLFQIDSKVLKEYAQLERKLRHRRVAANPNLRFCPNPECKKISVPITNHTDTSFRWPMQKDLFLLTLEGKSKDEASVIKKGRKLFFRCIDKSGVCCRNSLKMSDRDENKGIVYNERVAGISVPGQPWFIIGNNNTKNGKYLPIHKEGIGKLFEKITKEEYYSLRMAVSGIAIVDMNAGLDCWRCREKICRKCGSSAHSIGEGKDGEECTAIHEKEMLGMVNKDNNMVRCPKCQHIVSRIDGCDHMTCRCGAEFCFQCSAMPHCGSTCKNK